MRRISERTKTNRQIDKNDKMLKLAKKEAHVCFPCYISLLFASITFMNVALILI